MIIKEGKGEKRPKANWHELHSRGYFTNRFKKMFESSNTIKKILTAPASSEKASKGERF